MSDWQPIETAPEGTAVLIGTTRTFGPGGGFTIWGPLVAIWIDGAWEMTVSRQHPPYQPTHWQHLPGEPPEPHT